MASVKQSSAKTLTVEQACYFAGLMDGEGSITAAKDNGKRITWRISVINCVKGIVDWCSDVTGVGTMHERAPRNSRQHITYTWQCYSWNAEFVLRQIYPYLLHPEKRRRAELLFAQMDEIRALGIKEPL